MSFTCKDLDAALREQEPEALRAARAHAATCTACREALDVWTEIGSTAPLLQRAWESPDLWPRIHQELAVESQRKTARESRPYWRWSVAAASAGLVVLAGTWLVLRELSPSPAPATEDALRRLLTERALEGVERSEAEYIASIDQLAKVAEPRLHEPGSALLASYREKLQILDAAIADCRAEIDRNRFNAHLRRELLSIYREKQRTLQQLVEERT